MDSREFAEWMAFYSIEVFGEPAADIRNGLLCSLLANIWRGKGQRAFRPEDFMVLRERKRKGWRQLKAALGRVWKGKDGAGQ